MRLQIADLLRARLKVVDGVFLSDSVSGRSEDTFLEGVFNLNPGYWDW
jgi:hypothetical protein